jgi:hypothetical protein
MLRGASIAHSSEIVMHAHRAARTAEGYVCPSLGCLVRCMARALVHTTRHLVFTHPFTIHHINRLSGGKRVTFIEVAVMAVTRGENGNLSF